MAITPAFDQASFQPARAGRKKFDPTQYGWRIGRSEAPAGAGELWCPWDRVSGVIGPQGSGKSLDLLLPAMLNAPGAVLTTLTKPQDLLLTFTSRTVDGRPAAVLDPFGLADGLPELVWDPIAGCQDPLVAERRAKAFATGNINSASQGSGDSSAARFYALEAAKVLQAFFHAAALGDHNLDVVLDWVADPRQAIQPIEILRTHPQAADHWHGLLVAALHGDERTAGNTAATVHQTMSLFFQPDIRRRCVPSPGRPATDIERLLREHGTIYLLGREDPYASASPLMTAVAEHVLDTALKLAHNSPHGRLCPPVLACLDELPSTAPLPTLRTRMANERALGISIIYAAQTYRQLAALFGENEARAILGLTNVLIMFGGSKDVAFNKEVSDLVGTTRVARTTMQLGNKGGGSVQGDDMLIIRPEEVRQLPDKTALIVAENAKPILARLDRCVEGKAGRALTQQQDALHRQLTERRATTVSAQARAVAQAATKARNEALQ